MSVRCGSWLGLPQWEVSNAGPSQEALQRLWSCLSLFLSLSLSSRRTWQRWADPLCRPAAASSPARPAPGPPWSAGKRNVDDNGEQKNDVFLYRVEPLRSDSFMTWKKQKKITSLSLSVTTSRNISLLAPPPSTLFYLANPFLLYLAFVKPGSKGIQTGSPLRCVIWCLPCQDESVSEWHRHTWQRPPIWI